MGVFGGLIASALRNAAGQDGNAGVLGAMLNGALARTPYGSLQGMLDQLRASGLETQVSSWLGDGSNEPVTVEQIHDALGHEELQKLAAKLGMPLGQFTELMAQHLPGAVDKLSPNGHLAT